MGGWWVGLSVCRNESMNGFAAAKFSQIADRCVDALIDEL